MKSISDKNETEEQEISISSEPEPKSEPSKIISVIYTQVTEIGLTQDQIHDSLNLKDDGK